jgi:hypothetical protein
MFPVIKGSLEEVRRLPRHRRGTRFLSPSPVACPERSRRAPVWGHRITKSLSPEEGRSLPRHRRGTRFPGRRVLVAKYVQPRGPRHGEFPAAFTVSLPAEALAQVGHRPPATGP